MQSQAGASPNPRENSLEFSSRPEGHKSDMIHPCRRYEIGRVHHLARKYFADYATAAAAGSESVEISPIERFQRYHRYDQDAESNARNGEGSLQMRKGLLRYT